MARGCRADRDTEPARGDGETFDGAPYDLMRVDRALLKTPAVRALLALGFVVALAAFIFWPRGLPAPREENRQRDVSEQTREGAEVS